jgi:hypothetical protein
MHIPLVPPPAPFPPQPHLIYDPVTVLGFVMRVTSNAFLALTLLCLWVGLAAGLGLALAAVLHRYAGPTMTGRDAILTAAVLLTAGYVINSIPFWQGFPSVVFLVATCLLVAIRLSPVSPAAPGRVQSFWAGVLVPYSRGGVPDEPAADRRQP